MTRVTTRDLIKRDVAKLKEVGCTVEETEDTIIVKDGDIVVLQALETSKGSWLTRFMKSERISWTN